MYVGHNLEPWKSNWIAQPISIDPKPHRTHALVQKRELLILPAYLDIRRQSVNQSVNQSDFKAFAFRIEKHSNSLIG